MPTMAAELKNGRGGTSNTAQIVRRRLRSVRPFVSHSSLSGSPQRGHEWADDEIRFLQSGPSHRIEAPFPTHPGGRKAGAPKPLPYITRRPLSPLPKPPSFLPTSFPTHTF